MERNYGGVIWTNHALERLNQRNITQRDAWATFQHPDQSRYAKTKGTWIFYKTYGNEKYEVVGKKNERGEWIIMTVWSRPVYGEERRAVVHVPFWLKILRKIFGVR